MRTVGEVKRHGCLAAGVERGTRDLDRRAARLVLDIHRSRRHRARAGDGDRQGCQGRSKLRAGRARGAILRARLRRQGGRCCGRAGSAHRRSQCQRHAQSSNRFKPQTAAVQPSHVHLLQPKKFAYGRKTSLVRLYVEHHCIRLGHGSTNPSADRGPADPAAQSLRNSSLV